MDVRGVYTDGRGVRTDVRGVYTDDRGAHQRHSRGPKNTSRSSSSPQKGTSTLIRLANCTKCSGLRPGCPCGVVATSRVYTADSTARCFCKRSSAGSRCSTLRRKVLRSSSTCGGGWDRGWMLEGGWVAPGAARCAGRCCAPPPPAEGVGTGGGC
eukprot:1176789-Prorocentrum_minimum.AAC.3